MPEPTEAGSTCNDVATDFSRWRLKCLFMAWCFIAAVVVLLTVLNWWQFGRSNTERFLTELAQPLSLIWLVLAWIALWVRLRQRREPELRGVVWLALVWVLVTLAGNRVIANAAVQATEFPPQPPALLEEPFDFVVLLGGGLGAGPGDEPQLFQDGDRVRPVIQLYAAGKTPVIVVTGTAGIPGRPGPAEMAERLFISWGIPAEAIIPFEGLNTTEEMKALEQYIADWSDAHQGRSPRWGLATSAFHIPRALRLAAERGLQPVPLPTASRLNYEPTSWARLIIPTPDDMVKLHLCWKEWLAYLVGR